MRAVPSLLTLDEVQRIVHGITYKTGWQFFASLPPMASDVDERLVRVSVLTKTVDVYTLEPMPLTNAILCYPLDEAAVVRCVQELVEKLELHESHEWLKWNGKHITEPHPRPL